jgi:hypothetical protein
LNGAERIAAQEEREAFYRAAAMWAEKSATALVIVLVLIAFGFAFGVQARWWYWFVWPARVMQMVMIFFGAVAGWAVARFLPFVFKTITGKGFAGADTRK